LDASAPRTARRLFATAITEHKGRSSPGPVIHREASAAAADLAGVLAFFDVVTVFFVVTAFLAVVAFFAVVACVPLVDAVVLAVVPLLLVAVALTGFVATDRPLSAVREGFRSARST
jgi:hypothetical protein